MTQSTLESKAITASYHQATWTCICLQQLC